MKLNRGSRESVRKFFKRLGHRKDVQNRKVFFDKDAVCPRCKHKGGMKKHSKGERIVYDLARKKNGNGWVPRFINITYHKARCPNCRKHFSPDISFAPFGSCYSTAVHKKVLNLWFEGEFTLEKIIGVMRNEHGVYVSPTTLHDWISACESARVSA